jgi:hypothetical protein
MREGTATPENGCESGSGSELAGEKSREQEVAHPWRMRDEYALLPIAER